MKLGGLFSGVGGFELAWTQLGHEVAWMCEWDKNARKVLEARFPGVPIYPDVRDLDPAEVEAVDVLTGGSPCQGFSVAGTRSGLEHSESQLFADYVRIMDGLAERGLQYAVWENVPGVLSITNDDGERTFEHVVTALAGGTVPVRLPTDKRWNTGLAAGRGRAVAWRVLDSRYFGVAQRRRRVFACVAFGDSCEDRAGRALLAVSEGVRGDTPSSVEAGEGVAGSVAAGVGGPSGVSHTLTVASSKGATEDGTGRGTPLVADVSATVTSKWSKGVGGPAGSATETANMVVDAKWWDGGQTADSLTTTSDAQRMPDKGRLQAVMMHVRGGVDRDRHGKLAGKGPLLSYELSATLDATQPWTLFEPKAFRKSGRAQSSEDAESWVEDGQANTLNVFDVGDTRTTHAIVEPTLAPSLTASNDPSRSPQSSEVTQQVAAVNSAGYGVRRLTPVECERLQSFPDGWTEPAGSDSARYKAMGNAVTVNVVRWILGRLP
jgi:DNA (cytosine-5)-methyltransferase 1